MSHLGLTTSKEKVHFDGGTISEDLVPKNQIACWEFLFKKKSPEYIQEKINNFLPLKMKVVIVPPKSTLVFLNPYKPTSVLGAVQEALQQLETEYDAVIRPHEARAESAQELLRPLRKKVSLSEKELYCFTTLFGDEEKIETNKQTIQDRLNITWLPGSHKAIIIPSLCEIVFFDPKKPESLVVNTQELLEQVNSWFTVELVASENSKFSLMEAI